MNCIFFVLPCDAAKVAVPLHPQNGTSHEQHGFRH